MSYSSTPNSKYGIAKKSSVRQRCLRRRNDKVDLVAKHCNKTTHAFDCLLPSPFCLPHCTCFLCSVCEHVCVCVGVCVQVGFPSGIIRYKMARYRVTSHAPCAKIIRTTREVFTFLLAVCKSVAMLAKGTSFAMQHYGHNDHGTCGLVALTSASHAEGRQFDPGQV